MKMMLKKDNNTSSDLGSENKDFVNKKTPWHKRPVAKKVFIAAISGICAMLLWGYVLMSQNPDRTKTFGGVKVGFESGSEADLSARNLTVRGDIKEILGDVSVTVTAPLTDMTRMTSKDISATLNLNDVHGAGTFLLEVVATSSVGTVNSVDPAYIEVVIEDVVSRSIPVSYELTGQMPAGYWHDDPLLLSNSLMITGSRSDVATVADAVCNIDMDNLTESVNRSYDVVLFDVDGNEIDASIFTGTLPTVSVRMTVLPYKDVPIRFEVIGIENLPNVYEVTQQTQSSSSLRVAASQEVLDGIIEFTTEPVDVSDFSEPNLYEYTLDVRGIPEGTVILGNTQVYVAIEVRDRQVEVIFEDIPLTVIGETPELSYTYGFETVNVTIAGPARIVWQIKARDISAILDVTDLAEGSYDVEFALELENSEWELDVEIIPDVIFVNVVISLKSED